MNAIAPRRTPAADVAPVGFNRDYFQELVEREFAALVVLSLWDAHGSRDEISRIRLDGLTPEQVLDEVVQAATVASAEAVGTLRFDVAVLDRDERPLGRVPLRIEGSGYGDPGLAERPDGVGLQGQLMRHLEAKERLIQDLQRASIGQLASEVRRLQSDKEKLQAKVDEFAELKEKLLDRQEERIAAREQAKERAEGWKRTLDTIQALLPVVVNKVTGKPMVRQRYTDLEVLLFELAPRLKTERYEKLIQQLPHADKMLFATLFEQALKHAEIMQSTEEKQSVQERIHDLILGFARPPADATKNGVS